MILVTVSNLTLLKLQISRSYLSACGGSQVRSKGRGSGPRGVGLRGFESHPPHQFPVLYPLVELIFIHMLYNRHLK